MDLTMQKQNADFLWKIGNNSTCPVISRIYMFNFEKIRQDATDLLKIGKKKTSSFCNHCGSIWSAGNHSIKIKSAPPLNRHIKRIIKLESEQPWKTNKRQKKKLRKFQETATQIVYNCFVCNKKTNINKFQCNLKPASTPISKETLSPFLSPRPFKLKKGDLNAGLFISNNKQLYTLKDVQQRSLETCISETPLKSKTINLSVGNTSKTLLDSNTSLNELFIKSNATLIKNQLTPSNAKQRTPKLAASSTQKQSSGKKKSLLDQILKQQQSSKKKTSLSSFLVSL